MPLNSDTDLEETVGIGNIFALLSCIIEGTEAAEELTLAARSDSVTNTLNAA